MAYFFSFWYRGSLTAIERLCLKSFIDHGHDFTLYSYSDVDVPSGVLLRDASSVIPEDQVFFYKNGPGAGSVSAFSNLFRYKVLSELGGWWADTDVICLSQNVPSEAVCFAYEDSKTINGALLKIPARHVLAKSLLKEALLMGNDFTWGQCGPALITRVVDTLDMHQFAVPAHLLYPVHYENALDLLLPDRTDDIRASTKGSVFVHLWNEVFRRSGVLKDAVPPIGSYLWHKFKEHQVEFLTPAQYSEDSIKRLIALRKTDSEYCVLEEINTSLTNQLGKKNGRLRKLKETLNERQREIGRLSHENSRLRTEIVRLKNTLAAKLLHRITRLVGR